MADPMPPATATTTNGALSCPIRNNRTGRLDKATPRRGPQGSGADSRKKRRLREVRFAVDSPLEGAVSSEPVSGGPIPCYLGKYREFHRFLSCVRQVQQIGHGDRVLVGFQVKIGIPLFDLE
jgi:hypothetical protein